MRDKSSSLAERVAYYVRHGARSRSPEAFGFAILCVAAASALRYAVDLVAPNVVPFATYFPAVLAATLIGGQAAGILAMLLGGVVSWFLFFQPRYILLSGFQLTEVLSFAVYIGASITIIWISEQYRRVLQRLDEAEHYRQIVVAELGHRVKNKLATIQSILQHALRDRPEQFESIWGRLRALSVADDFLLQGESEGVELRDLLTMELRPYGESRVRMRGCPLRLTGKLPSVLSLILHELATNAAKYGALSVEQGCVTIGWRLDRHEITIDWEETGGPRVSPPGRRSFGTNLIERSLDGFGGSALLDFLPSGVVCRIRLPHDSLAAS